MAVARTGLTHIATANRARPTTTPATTMTTIHARSPKTMLFLLLEISPRHYERTGWCRESGSQQSS